MPPFENELSKSHVEHCMTLLSENATYLHMYLQGCETARAALQPKDTVVKHSSKSRARRK
jgi:hypothetical protein